jgi:hypothetical protein
MARGSPISTGGADLAMEHAAAPATPAAAIAPWTTLRIIIARFDL